MVFIKSNHISTELGSLPACYCCFKMCDKSIRSISADVTLLMTTVEFSWCWGEVVCKVGIQLNVIVIELGLGQKSYCALCLHSI